MNAFDLTSATTYADTRVERIEFNPTVANSFRHLVDHHFSLVMTANGIYFGSRVINTPCRKINRYHVHCAV